MNATAIAQQIDVESAIQQIANGAILRDIAAQYGVPKQRISEVLRQHPGYAAAREVAIETKIDDAEENLAREGSDIARAREVWRAATWRAERECPHRWGAKGADVGVAVQVVVKAFGPGDTDRSHEVVATVASPRRESE